MHIKNPFFCSRWDCIPERFQRENIIVRLKCPTDIVVARFDIKSWHNIFSDIQTDQELNAHLTKNPQTSQAYILENRLTGESFGWIYLCRHDNILCDTVEFHGGAWKKGMGTARLKFCASCVVIDQLLRLGIRVCSRAYKENLAALKFLQGIGFVIVHRPSQKPYVYLTLSRMRFYGQPVVKACLNAIRKMKFWKWLFALVGLDILLGIKIFDGQKGRIGCGWVIIFIIIFFHLWLAFKCIIFIFKLLLFPFKRRI